MSAYDPECDFFAEGPSAMNSPPYLEQSEDKLSISNNDYDDKKLIQNQVNEFQASISSLCQSQGSFLNKSSKCIKKKNRKSDKKIFNPNLSSKILKNVPGQIFSIALNELFSISDIRALEDVKKVEKFQNKFYMQYFNSLDEDQYENLIQFLKNYKHSYNRNLKLYKNPKHMKAVFDLCDSIKEISWFLFLFLLFDQNEILKWAIVYGGGTQIQQFLLTRNMFNYFLAYFHEKWEIDNFRCFKITIELEYKIVSEIEKMKFQQ